MAIIKGYRIKDVLSKLEDGDYVLPVIQRGFVWDEGKIYKLFDSILRGNPFGAIMAIEESKGTMPLFASRRFSKEGMQIPSTNSGELSRDRLFIIDGQQRLQSLLIGIKGSLNGHSLFFDIFSTPENEFEFKFESDLLKLPSYSNDESRNIRRRFWVRVEDLYLKLQSVNDPDIVAENALGSFDSYDRAEIKTAERNVKAFFNSIFGGDVLGISQITLNNTGENITILRQQVVELFRRLNDGGTVLTGWDLAASLLKGLNPEMESFLLSTPDKFRELGLTQDNLIKLFFVLQDQTKRDLADINFSDAKFVVDNKDRIIETLKCLKSLVGYLNMNNYYNSSNRSFVPLYALAYHIFHKNVSTDKLATFYDNIETNTEFPYVRRWLLLSLLMRVFSSGSGWRPTTTGLKKIVNVLSKNKGLSFPMQDIFDMYYDHGLHIFTESITVDNVNKLDHDIIYYLVYKNQRVVRQVDVDHIHPKSLLDKQGFGPSEINHIGNYQLIDFSTNRGLKSDLEFYDFVHQYVQSIPTYLEQHLIPNDSSTWKSGHYQDFLQVRLELLVGALSRAVM